MNLLAAFAPFLLMQVGPNPSQTSDLGTPDELLNRPARPDDGLMPDSAEARWLGECLALVDTDPARAHARSQIRRQETSGPMQVVANHCLGLAATKLELWEDAVDAFGRARDGTPSGETRAKARFGVMAGSAALASGDPARADQELTRAISDARTSASATLEGLGSIDHARALVALDQPQPALTALENATRLVPDSSEAWLLKATLLRRMERLGDAQAAIEQAATLAPESAEVGLEAAGIAALQGRFDAARKGFASVIDLAPDTFAARRAAEYLEMLPLEADTEAAGKAATKADKS